MINFNSESFLRETKQQLFKHLSCIQAQEEFSHLNYNIELLLLQSKQNVEQKYKITNNACFSIHKSQGFIYELKKWLDNHLERISLELPNNVQLHIKATLSERKNRPTKTMEEENKPNNVSLFAPTSPKYSFEQMILPKEVKQEIDEALNIIKHQNLIYKDWGFETVDPVPKSVLNFYGPPGTGKTMCAHAIANFLQRPLLSLNYSEIESKYVGEAPKNLQQAFDVAKEYNCVMFFDEADSFLGKRIENVTQGADQALNSLRSQMLILLEEFSGVVLFATNLVTNFDKAFESRILKHIKFELPNEEARTRIISKMLPKQLPFSSKYSFEDLQLISKEAEGFSGREIKSAILETLLSKATKEEKNAMFEISDFVERFKIKKQEMIRLKEEASKKNGLNSSIKEQIKSAIEKKEQN